MTGTQSFLSGGSVIFNVSGIGPQGPVGPNGATISSIENCVSSQAITASQNQAFFTNQGASDSISLDLPSSQTPFVPMVYSFLVVSSETLNIVAAAGMKIQNGSDVSSAGGYFSSNTVGNLLVIALVSPTLWVVTSLTGIWSLA